MTRAIIALGATVFLLAACGDNKADEGRVEGPVVSESEAPRNPAVDTAPGGDAALTPGAAFDDGKSLGLDRKVWGVTGLVKWTLTSSLSLNSTTAYRQFDSYETFDADGLSLPLLTAAEQACRAAQREGLSRAVQALLPDSLPR